MIWLKITYLKLLEKKPDDPNIRLNLAKVFELKNDNEASIEELKKSEEISPDHVKTLYSIAEKFEGASDSESLKQWEDYMRKIVENAPKNIVARIYLVEALIRSGQGDEALKNLEQTQQIYPAFPSESQEYFSQAISFLQQDNIGEAFNSNIDISQFLEINPRISGRYSRTERHAKCNHGSTSNISNQ